MDISCVVENVFTGEISYAVHFPIDEDDWQEVLESIGNPELYGFISWECDCDEVLEYVMTLVDVDDINDVAEHFSNVDDDILNAFIEVNGIDCALTFDSWRDCSLHRHISNTEDLGIYLIDNLDYERIPDYLRGYFDFEAYGDDWDNDHTYSGFCDDGYLEVYC